MPECIFCNLVHDPTSKLVWQNDLVVAFNDIHPKAKVHILIVPKKHISTFHQLEDPKLIVALVKAIQAVADQLQLAGGYRVVCNVGKDGGQIVDHLHFHLLSGNLKGETEL